MVCNLKAALLAGMVVVPLVVVPGGGGPTLRSWNWPFSVFKRRWPPWTPWSPWSVWRVNWGNGRKKPSCKSKIRYIFRYILCKKKNQNIKKQACIYKWNSIRFFVLRVLLNLSTIPVSIGLNIEIDKTVYKTVIDVARGFKTKVGINKIVTQGT